MCLPLLVLTTLLAALTYKASAQPSTSDATSATATSNSSLYGWHPSLTDDPSTNWEILVGPHAPGHGTVTGTTGSSTSGDMSLSSMEASLKRENEILRKRVHALRQQLGACFCREKPDAVGPTGGFCMDLKERRGVGGNEFMDKPLAQAIGTLFSGKRVLDLGCGMGQYGQYLTAQQYGFNITWIGFDGSENIEAVTDGRVKFMDLAQPQWLGGRYDWVLSLEVGEHIPAVHETTFIHNIVRHASMGVVLSWAVRGQGGHHHVNCHDNDYIRNRMKELGFEAELAMDEELRNVARLPWFKHTVMVFRRTADVEV